MKTACQFAKADEAWGCMVCGRRVRAAGDRPPIAVCRGPRGLGDMVADGSSTVGITKEPAQSRGPGTELKAILSGWLGIEADEQCGCRAMSARMDALGVAWCLSGDGMAEILSVMREEHGKRWADGRTKLPWTDLGAKTLVRLACRRAEAKASA